MRLLLTLLMGLALAMLPAAGTRAEAAAPAMACHQDMPDDNAGVACAEHCMMLVTAARPTPALQPSVANAVRAPLTLSNHLRTPQAAPAPATPPPRR